MSVAGVLRRPWLVLVFTIPAFAALGQVRFVRLRRQTALLRKCAAALVVVAAILAAR